MRRVTHYRIAFNPRTNLYGILVKVEGSDKPITVPVNSGLEFISLSLILQSGNAIMDENGTLICDK